MRMNKKYVHVKKLVQKQYKDLKIKSTIFDSYLRCYDILTRYADLELSKIGTTLSRRAVMRAIIILGGKTTPTNISKMIYRTPRAITSTLDALEKDGIIIRRHNKIDRRSVDVIITDKGWESVERKVPRTNGVLEKAICGLTDAEQDLLRLLLDKLTDNLLTEKRTRKYSDRAENSD
jgi:DNA-binding MarR family transcriptional regulator